MVCLTKTVLQHGQSPMNETRKNIKIQRTLHAALTARAKRPSCHSMVTLFIPPYNSSMSRDLGFKMKQ